MSRKRVQLVTAGLMLSLFLASMESTVVSTASPTIVGQLGGLETYSWVFTAFMVASTTTVPIFGKLSDLFGRRPTYAAALGIFLAGSLLCGAAQSMGQLIAFRLIQGLGAGGLLPLVFTIIGELFTLEQRARMQGLFSGVWGISAIVGPLLGGFLVDQVSWRWVFFINIPFGLVAGALVWFAWVDRQRPMGAARPAIDWAGVGLLSLGVVLLMLALLDIRQPLGWGLLAAAVICVAALLWVERRAADPVLPLPLFRDRVFAVACVHGVLAGCALFGSASFVPLFAQAVLGTSATGAGAVLAPMLIGWVISSIVGGRLLLRLPYRVLTLGGTALLALGSLFVARIDAGTSRIALGTALALMGIGMGLCVPAFLIAVQSAVRRRDMGSATSTMQFSRSIGSVIGVSVMGAVLSIILTSRLAAAGLDVTLVDRLLSPEGATTATAQLEGAVRAALASAIRGAFVVALIASLSALAVTLLTPGGRIGQLERRPDEPDAAPTPVVTGD
jgi:EmrB/QacA subfamily drug resistance transporter